MWNFSIKSTKDKTRNTISVKIIIKFILFFCDLILNNQKFIKIRARKSFIMVTFNSKRLGTAVLRCNYESTTNRVFMHIWKPMHDR